MYACHVLQDRYPPVTCHHHCFSYCGSAFISTPGSFTATDTVVCTLGWAGLHCGRTRADSLQAAPSQDQSAKGPG
jgi:hypothetical protein